MLQISRITASETYSLRHRLLRPGQTLEQCHFPGDYLCDTAHFGAFLWGELVGIVSVYSITHKQLDEPDAWQLRAMAIKESVRGRGYGVQLASKVESYVLSQGGRCIWANARLKALGFYTKLGYSVLGEQFNIANIGPHYLVHKELSEP